MLYRKRVRAWTLRACIVDFVEGATLASKRHVLVSNDEYLILTKLFVLSSQ
jgi:hypothetical protein